MSTRADDAVTAPAHDGTHRARLLVLGALGAGVATLVLVVVLLVRRGGAGPVLGFGVTAFGTAALACGLLVLARAGALARDGAGNGGGRAAALLTRCLLGAGAAAAVALVTGAIAATATHSPAPAWGAAVSVVLLSLLAALAFADRGAARSGDAGERSGAPGASEDGPAADAR